MTIDKAIKMLNEILLASDNLHYKDYPEALKLGIEALKRIQKLRGYSMTQVDTRLPGETEE